MRAISAPAAIFLLKNTRRGAIEQGKSPNGAAVARHRRESLTPKCAARNVEEMFQFCHRRARIITKRQAVIKRA